MKRSHSIWTQLVAAACAALMGCGEPKTSSHSAEIKDKLPVPLPKVPEGPIHVPDDSIVPSQEIGTLPGSLEVTPAGRAAYTIPLQVPEGRAGIQPKLALSFNDGTPNGPLGVGWSLSGLSQIAPCSRTTAQDGAPDAVHFEPGDAYCLGGTRLVAVQGNSGQDGTVYRAERDDLVKVVSRGSHSSGVPDRFVAHHPDGTTWHYTRAIEATQVHYKDVAGNETPEQRKVVWAWALERVEDRIGNHMTVEYNVITQGSSSGSFAYENRFALEFYPRRFLYTGHKDGDAPRREIRFIYGARGDAIDVYKSGVHRKIGKRLVRIEAHAPNPETTERVWYYQLGYQSTKTTERSLIKGVTLCDAFDKCVPPTTFEWSESTHDFTRRNTGIQVLDGAHMADMTPADFNGDGKTDLLFWSGQREYCECVDSDCNEIEWYPSGDHCDEHGTFRVNGEWKIAYSDGTTLTNIESTGLFAEFSTREHQVADELPGAPPQEYNKPIVLDFDGDGAADLLSARTGEVLSPSKGYAVLQDLGSTFEHLPPFWEPDVRYLGDFDGDGRVDLFSNDNRAVPTVDGGGYVTGWNSVLDWDDYDWSYQLGGGEPGFGARQAAGIRPFMQRFDHVLDAPAIDPTNHSISMDVDGDGRTELILPAPGNEYRSFEIGADGAPEVDDVNLSYLWHDMPGVTPVSEYVPIYLDINGDGLRDVIASGGVDLGNGHIDLFARINTGQGYGPWYVAAPGGYRRPPSPWDTGGPALHDNGVRVFDYNGDGRDDFVVPGEDGDDPLVYLSNGRVFSSFTPGFDLEAPAGMHPPASIYHFVGYTHRVGDIDGDGKADLFMLDMSSPGKEIVIWQRDDNPLAGVDAPLEALVKITNGLGQVTKVSRAPLSSSGYKPGDACSFPQRCLRSGGHVVSYVHRDTPGEHTFYDYEDARVDVTGRGFLGFRKMLMKTSGLEKTTIQYGNDVREHGAYPLAGVPVSIRNDVPIDVNLTHRSTLELVEYDVDWSFGDQVYRVRPSRTSKQIHDTSGTVFPPAVLHEADADRLELVFQTWDSYGNLDTELAIRSGWIEPEGGGARVQKVGSRTFTDHDYQNDESEWLLGVETRKEVVGHAAPPATGSATRLTEIVPDQHGRPHKVIVEPGDPRLRHETTYHYGNLGELERIDRQNSPADPEAPHQLRVERITYDQERLYPIEHCNALTQCSDLAVHPAFGLLVMADDPNGQRTVHHYDGFGRPRGTVTTGGRFQFVDYLPSAAGAYAERVFGSDGSESRSEYLKTGHLFKVTKKAFDGTQATRDIEYDVHGKVSKESNWYLDPAERAWTTYDYDGLDRVVETDGPNGRIEMTYATDEVRTTDGEGNESYLRYDVSGRVTDSVDVHAEDGSLARTSYVHGPFDLVQTVTGPLGHEKGMKYDGLGRMIDIDDPDAGHRSFTFNGFGEVIESRDPESQAAGTPTVYERDQLGRVLKITSVDGTDTYTWDAPPAGSGALPWIGARHATVSADGTETRQEYDALGRLARVRTKAEGTWFDVEYDYDIYSRLKEIAYPEVSTGPRFRVQRSYSPNGSLARLWTVDENGNDYELWEASKRNADGRATHEVYGGTFEAFRAYQNGTARVTDIQGRQVGTSAYQFAFGHKYYDNGNLRWRGDNTSGFGEGYTYDSLNRLKTWTRGEGKQVFETTYDYDLGGNLKWRKQRGGKDIDETFHRGKLAAQQDFLTRYERWVDGVQTIDTSMHYDDNGRRIKGPWDRVDYTRFDLPRRIENGDKTEYGYDADGHRVSEFGPDGLHLRIEQLYEYHKGDGVNEHVYLVPSDEGVVAQVVQKDGDTFRKFLYMHRDHLGSTVMVTDEAGSVHSAQWFTPFGQRTHGEGRPSLGDEGDRLVAGFTGHRNDDQLGLIDMNGRIYDPLGSSFLTPDPIISQPYRGQDHNRYSYALNNPINITDPTGLQEVDVIQMEPFYFPAEASGNVIQMEPFYFPAEASGNVIQMEPFYFSAEGSGNVIQLEPITFEQAEAGSSSAGSVDDRGSSASTPGQHSAVMEMLSQEASRNINVITERDVMDVLESANGPFHITADTVHALLSERFGSYAIQFTPQEAPSPPAWDPTAWRTAQDYGTTGPWDGRARTLEHPADRMRREFEAVSSLFGSVLYAEARMRGWNSRQSLQIAAVGQALSTLTSGVSGRTSPSAYGVSSYGAHVSEARNAPMTSRSVQRQTHSHIRPVPASR